MKLILENEFTWDGLYGILDEEGNRVYNIDARIEDEGRIIGICDLDNNELGTVRQKREAKRPEYEFTAGGKKIGSITRKGPEYDIKFIDWFVTGNLIQWNYRVVDKFSDIASSCIENECLAMEIADKDHALGTAILMMGIAGLTGDLVKEYSGEADGTDVHDVINTVGNIAGKTVSWGQKALTAIEKLYDVYEEPKADAGTDELVRKTSAHDVAHDVEAAIDKVEEVGHKTKAFIEKLYGLNEEESKDEGRK